MAELWDGTAGWFLQQAHGFGLDRFIASLRSLAERARAAAAGPYSWDSIAERTMAVYEKVLA